MRINDILPAVPDLRDLNKRFVKWIDLVFRRPHCARLSRLKRRSRRAEIAIGESLPRADHLAAQSVLRAAHPLRHRVRGSVRHLPVAGPDVQSVAAKPARKLSLEIGYRDPAWVRSIAEEQVHRRLGHGRRRGDERRTSPYRPANCRSGRSDDRNESRSGNAAYGVACAGIPGTPDQAALRRRRVCERHAEFRRRNRIQGAFGDVRRREIEHARSCPTTGSVDRRRRKLQSACPDHHVEHAR